MAQLTISGTVTDSSGATASFSVVASNDVVGASDAITIAQATVQPTQAPPGTLRTLTVAASSAQNLPLTATLTAVQGITFTPVDNQPAGQFQWTFTF